MKNVSEIDKRNYETIRQSVSQFQKNNLLELRVPSRILDIAPEKHGGIMNMASSMHTVETLDISEKYSPTYVMDICSTTPIASETFDVIFCTEVIEHVNNPFLAIIEIHRLLKPGGIFLATSPLNFRIHGPLPDNWRITEHGWRVLLKPFRDFRITEIEDPDRFLFPIHYQVRAVKHLHQ